MFTVSFRTRTYRPDAEITLRTAIDGWNEDLPALYVEDEWRVELDEDRYRAGMDFKFVLDRTLWMLGENLHIVPEAGQAYRFDEGRVQFPDEPTALVVENGIISRLFFAPVAGDEPFDVIVVGSGAGGGVLADQLSDLGKRVLVLEAGSYLFPTHVANLPRELWIGAFDKHVWRLWYRFKVDNYVNGPGSEFAGGHAFNLGGRSLFWGGLAPRMADWESEAWPRAVASDLHRGRYRRAEEILNVRQQRDSPYQQRTKALLGRILPDYVHMGAPMAVQTSAFDEAGIATGLFSTADLLMESRLTEAAAGSRNLAINLNHRVVRLEHDGRRIERVVARDLVAGRERTFRGQAVVLAAGTIETAKVALASGLADQSALVGRGLTDHPILYTHFALPWSSPHADPSGASKTLSRRRDSSVDHHPYTVVVEIGADFNQGRYIDDDLLAAHLRERPGVLGEIVFLFHAPLLDGNTVQLQGSVEDPSVLTMTASPVAGPYRGEIDQVKDRVLAELGAVPLPGQTLELKTGLLGGVAHEVGTMRMGEDEGAVVSPDLRMWGYENLYVCDLSVLPVSPAANPTLTLVALADRLAVTLATAVT